MKYSVGVTDAAHGAIRYQARYIAIECQAPLNDERWLQQVLDVIDGLEHMPSRHNLAAENVFKTYEVRRAIVGNYLLLFTVTEAKNRVWVIGFRRGDRLPHPDDLPDEPPHE